MDVLCTDKTGTLTEGVVRLDAALDVGGRPSEGVLRLAYLNAHFQTGLASPLDGAILSSSQPDVSGSDKLDEVPYDFVRKRLSVVIKDAAGICLITKGALENVLAVSTRLAEGGAVVPLDGPANEELRRLYTQWSAQGFRVLGVATKPMSQQAAYTRADECELTFAGFLLFFDPPKSGVQETVADLRNLGVRLKIITGDNRLAALHAAEAVGLETTGVLSGAELDKMHDEALWHAAERTNLFVEVDPNQKERILLAVRKMGHVVGYMGDGINDAPALHAADVGISVDSAVDVAKEAADFVLLEKNLAVLHEGIIQGRTTFANTLKYVFLAASANFGNMFSVAGASLFLPFLPMLPMQILLLNFLTDLPEMTIAGDTVDPTFVERPHRWDISFIRRFMTVFGLLSSVFDCLTFALLLLLLGSDAELFRTGWFVESALSATLVVFALRTRLPFWRSRPSRALLVVTTLVGILTLALPYSPVAPLLEFRPLPLSYLLLVTVIILAYFASAELTKRLFYRLQESA
jgi:Mg2+-importing ATPase